MFNNRSRTLQLLFAHKLLSRTDIAEYLNITTAAVTTIVNDFLEKDLLIQQELLLERQPRAGRKKAPLCINYNWKYILTIDIHSYYVNIAVTNLEGKIITEWESLTPQNSSPEFFCSSIAKECISMLWKASIPMEKLLGAGITIIGPVNENDGIALHPFRLFDTQIPIQKLFEKEFPFPVAVESNVCAFLASELLYTDIRENAQNILMLKWGPGVGSSMAIRGELYKGCNYQSTEIGHNMIAQSNGKKCNCGLTGCLEPYISTDAIVSFIIQETFQHPEGELAKLSKELGSPTRQNLPSFLESSSLPLWNFLKESAYALASVTNNAIHLLAPDHLLLMGDLFELDSIVKLFEEQLRQINPHMSNDLCVKAPHIGNPKYIGAAATAINHLLLPVQ